MTKLRTTLRTARLLLRPFRPEDLPAYRAIRSDPETARYLPGGTAAAAEAPERARRTIEAWGAAAWAEGGYAPWAVEHDGRLIGHLGLRYLPEIEATELLYLLERPAWGRGFATEGGRAAVEFARDRLGLDYLVALAMPENSASIAVMRRCGFEDEGPTHIFGVDAVRYGLHLRQPIIPPLASG